MNVLVGGMKHGHTVCCVLDPIIGVAVDEKARRKKPIVWCGTTKLSIYILKSANHQPGLFRFTSL